MTDKQKGDQVTKLFQEMDLSGAQWEYHLVGGTGQTEPPPSQEGLMSTSKLKGKKIQSKKMGKPIKNQEHKNFKSK